MNNIAKVPAGSKVDHILTTSVTAVQGKWANFQHRALECGAALPGVQNAAFAWGVPLTGNNWQGAVEIEGQPVASKPSERLSIPLRSITPGYFDLLGLTVTEGRDFRATDGRNAPGVGIVNQALAERYF